MENSSLSGVLTVSISVKDDHLVTEKGMFEAPSPEWKRCIRDNCSDIRLAISAQDPKESFLIPALFVTIEFFGVKTGYYMRSLRGRHHFYFTGAAPFFILGVKNCQRTLFGVEGVLDAYSVNKAGFPVMASLSNSLGSYAMDMMCVMFKKKYFERFVYIYDSDEGGVEGANILQRS